MIRKVLLLIALNKLEAANRFLCLACPSEGKLIMTESIAKSLKATFENEALMDELSQLKLLFLPKAYSITARLC